MQDVIQFQLWYMSGLATGSGAVWLIWPNYHQYRNWNSSASISSIIGSVPLSCSSSVSRCRNSEMPSGFPRSRTQLSDNAVLRLAQDQADARLVTKMAQHVVDGKVEVHLAGIFRFE